MTQTLSPTKSTLDIKGKLSYGVSNRAWNTIKFKKEFLQEFKILKERRSAFSYQMLFYRTYEELENAVRRMKRNKEALPILLFLKKDNPR